ncbi:MAG: hypothetical protein CMF86_00275 [Candidatus Marinimicrobia bacterium]|nr:hypothetical protein [Candidatus Neomarinimicrobiota bacterium]
MAITKIKGSNIEDGTVVAADVADGAVTTDKILDANVTTAKILDANITDAKIAAVGATKLTGNIADARIPQSAVTQHVAAVDLSAVRQDIAMLAMYNSVSDNRAAYNLPYSFIDTFQDDTGLTTQTNVDRVADDEYVASVYTTSGKFVADANTVLLVDFETDPVTDASASGHTLTATGNAARVSNAKKFGSYSGRTGNGTWAIPSSTDFAFPASTDFTVEFWINVVSWGANADKQMFSGPGAGVGMNLGAASSSSYQPYYHTPVPGQNHGTWSGLSHTGDGAAGAWFHYALSRAGGTIWSHSNGVRTGTSTVNFAHIAEPKFIGAYATNAQQWDFYMDELRVTKGLARYGSGNFTPQADVVVDNATGTLISDTQTASVATTKMSGAILYKDNAGTATLGTDLKIYLSANNGTNWTEVVSYGAVTPLFSAGIKMVRLGETTVTSGTAPVIKAVWANQAESSKETQLHGWAMNY